MKCRDVEKTTKKTKLLLIKPMENWIKRLDKQKNSPWRLLKLVKESCLIHQGEFFNSSKAFSKSS